MERTADFCDHVTYSFPKHTNRVFHNPTALHTAIDMFDPDASSGQLLIERLLFVRKRATTRFLEQKNDCCVSSGGSRSARLPFCEWNARPPGRLEVQQAGHMFYDAVAG
jgi:hypothetical protein